MTTFYDLAVMLVSRSRYDLAERQLRRSLEENPEHAASYALLGVCLAHLKKPREGLAAANEGLRLDPTLPYAHYARACVHLINARNLTQARKDVEEAIRLDPTRPSPFFLLSAIYSDRRRSMESLAQAERGLQLDPNHTGCASLRALALQRLGRKQEAEAAIAQALMLDPNNDFTHTAQGWRLLQKNNRKAARAHFLEALRINPENRWAQNGLASSKLGAVSSSFMRLCLVLATLRVVTAVTWLHDGVAVFLVSAGLVAMGLIAIAAGLLWIRDSLRNAAK